MCLRCASRPGALPPVPLQVKPYFEVLLRVAVESFPEVAFVPVQAPEAVHDVAFVVLQVNVAALPAVIEVGEALSETVGGGVGGGRRPLLEPPRPPWPAAVVTAKPAAAKPAASAAARN